MVNRRVVRLNLRKINQVRLAVVDGRGRVHASGVPASRDCVVFLSCLRGLSNRHGRAARCVVRSGLTRCLRGPVVIRRATRRKSRRLIGVVRLVVLRLFYYLVLLNNGVLLVVRHIIYVVDLGRSILYIGVAGRNGGIPRLVQIPCRMRLRGGIRLGVERLLGIRRRDSCALRLRRHGREGLGVLLLKLRREVRDLRNLRKVREVRARARRIVVHDLAVSRKDVQAAHEIRTTTDVVLKRVNLRNLCGQRGRPAHVDVVRARNVAARRGRLALLALRLLRGKVLRIIGGRLVKALAIRRLLGIARSASRAACVHLVAKGAHATGDACRSLLEESGYGVRGRLGLRRHVDVRIGCRICGVRLGIIRVCVLHAGGRLGVRDSLDVRGSILRRLLLDLLGGSLLLGNGLGGVVAVLAGVLLLASKLLRKLLALCSGLLLRELLHRTTRVQRNIALRGIVGGANHVHHAQHCRKRGLVVVRTRRAGGKLLIDCGDPHGQQRKRGQNAHDPEYVPKAFRKKTHQLHERANRNDHRAVERRALKHGLVPCDLGAAQQVLVRAVVVRHYHDGAVALHHKGAGSAVDANHVLAAAAGPNVAQHVTAGKLHGKQHEGSRHKNEPHRTCNGSQEPCQQNAHKHDDVQHIVRELPLRRCVKLLHLHVKPMLLHEGAHQLGGIKVLLAVGRRDVDLLVKVIKIGASCRHAIVLCPRQRFSASTPSSEYTSSLPAFPKRA